ncbi:MAG: tetraacyldisaccharide 4'-kinase [Prevotella salivae]|uniref:Tetraacyldisaccharide 4'-kinase n=1 Tax=Segatella salivae DSM 15606 TaxID=888832 RepID=E6MMV4_9BACT|nr:tetraacyldisaccharide 4'-kinase [Segatella salivae]EFV05058.1 tetraacyldisaccharide 4'-kinase [Segatella salivae DSM 15606]MBF1524528.1 tetraacyldisaccharide 4'-kinase [Segatella salivae]MBF1533323.1 tetraacyldisaccharide 4'-kinase [Segatella salivae]
MRTEGDFIHINEWLIPLSWLYGIGVGFRNQLFNIGLLKQHDYDIPIISVGNITVGGAGKTPHVEYLIRLLKDKVKVAVLSRGYKRKTHGYVLANDSSTVTDIGDEPYQMKQKYQDVHIAVDKKRVDGIAHITGDAETNDTDVILLDDAFQHRYVKPGINILLVDYHRLIIYDKLLPAGRLREPQSGKNRADIVIITKCPKDLKPMEFRVLTKAMNLYPYQSLYFTTIEYESLTPLFAKEKSTIEKEALEDKHVMLITGIASPKQIIIDLKPHVKEMTTLAFSDHHQFKSKDIMKINETFNAIKGEKIIVTTEKDATRLEQLDGLSEEVKQNLYVLPIKVKFMINQEEEFNDKIIDYVRKNSRNSILVKGKDGHKSKDSHNSGHRPRTISFRDN